MTYEGLLLIFGGAAFIAIGLIALMLGFFLGVSNLGERSKPAPAILLIGAIALVAGVWLMRAIQ